MADDRVSFSHPIAAEISNDDISRFAELIATELSAKSFAQTGMSQFRMTFFDVNVDHEMTFTIKTNTGKALVEGSIGLDTESRTTKAFVSNGAWGMIGVAIVVGIIADSILLGIGAAVVVALIDHAAASGNDQKTRNVVTDAINRAFVKL